MAEPDDGLPVVLDRKTGEVDELMTKGLRAYWKRGGKEDYEKATREWLQRHIREILWGEIPNET